MLSITDIGNERGSFAKKENRAVRLMKDKKKIIKKLEGFIKRGNGETFQARVSYACLLILDTGMRVGNENSSEGFVSTNKYSEFFNKNVKTYGATTMLGKHISKRNGVLHFNFLGKKCMENTFTTTNKVLIKYRRVVEKDELYLGVSDYDLRKFIKKYIGRNYSPKDFRTMKANEMFLEFQPTWVEEKTSARKKQLRDTIEQVAIKLNHTMAICRKAYISPVAITNFIEQ